MKRRVGVKICWVTSRNDMLPVVSLYQTLPVPLVSTSAQNGAINILSSAKGNERGVYCLSAIPNEITPLLFTYGVAVSIMNVLYLQSQYYSMYTYYNIASMRQKKYKHKCHQ